MRLLVTSMVKGMAIALVVAALALTITLTLTLGTHPPVSNDPIMVLPWELEIG